MLVRSAYEQCNGNQVRAAQLLENLETSKKNLLSLVSKTGSALTSGPLAVCVSTATTASSSVSIPARFAKVSSVRMSPFFHLIHARWQICNRQAARCLSDELIADRREEARREMEDALG